MNSKHTKAGRRARERAHHKTLAREVWGAYQGRRFNGWLVCRGARLMPVHVTYGARS